MPLVQTKFKSMFLVSSRPEPTSTSEAATNTEIIEPPTEPSPSSYKCPHCYQEFSVNEHLQDHIKNAHPNSILHECNICNYKTDNLSEYKKHFESHNKIDQISKTDFANPMEPITEESVLESKLDETCNNCGQKPDLDPIDTEYNNDEFINKLIRPKPKRSYPLYYRYPKGSVTNLTKTKPKKRKNDSDDSDNDEDYMPQLRKLKEKTQRSSKRLRNNTLN